MHFICVWQNHLASSCLLSPEHCRYHLGRTPCFYICVSVRHFSPPILPGRFHKLLNTTIPVPSTSNQHFITNGIQYSMFWALWRLISEKAVDFIPSSSVLSYYDGRGMYNTFLSTSETKADPFWDNLLKGLSSVSLSA